MRFIKFLLLISLAALCQLESSQAVAKTVAAIALFNDRAMLSVDGSNAKIISAGATFQGVKVISSNTTEAVIEVGGERKTLRLSGTAVIGDRLGSASKTVPTSIVLYENEVGFFEANGEVNGRSIRFLIDTGANLVVFNSVHAARLGLDYQSGVRGYATTASGRADMYMISLKSMSLGGIMLKDIRAGVIEGGFPEIPLLGMTFLNRLNMNRSGQTMVLERR
ncbi:MAG: aspartyl protease family protein [Arenicella sp.]|jgi:aspartyl protease family protein